ncbi:GGDEF domain-containing protein [Acinetobacter sp. KAM398]|nr:GGDEF domain-containing protein [Acinetobacter sp. KAM392]GJC33184.1 GGDEF domain-containing protein [Acinetobacter sp. KAM393]GJC36013.1 GGDEF domain-containing protein [Acinetobacter sp. KAM394]GJC38832.1 GGDEF domain-containing protein [Acinetobacter sp. KAM395]GJC41939.1 GGDEF domain-containing protein [Acinetobacter sp. KAM396]GJC44473.1 GGDEF domain-containing protein [Acinetobacter sp. KAM397]GJC47337.1 GGDEF domain-containing protein [Acinetobacter sp. KAM398]GJC50395.1 GGDEF doma
MEFKASMEYKYKLAKLQYDKEKNEELIKHQRKRAGQVFPKQLEVEFWKQHLEQARHNINQYFWSGVLIYFIITVMIITGDYWIIDRNFFKHDFIHSLLGLVNGAFCLLSLFFFAHYKILRAYYPYAAMALTFWAIVSMTWLTMTVITEVFRYQAMMIISMIYIMGFVLTGVKPFHMLLTGLMAAVVAMIMLLSLHIPIDVMVMGRVLVGSTVMGFLISKMLCTRERMIFLVMHQARLSEKINRIHAEELLHLSQHDALTKVSNRRTFDEMLDSYFEQARHDEVPLSLLFIDVDFFKKYNDHYGHQKGDEVISAIAKSIKDSIRHMDFVARYGGEEFVVLLPETDAHGAYAVASNIFKAVERLAIPHSQSLVSSNVTISLGFTVYKGEAEIFKSDFLQRADQALYRAKQLGRNQIYYHTLQVEEVL